MRAILLHEMEALLAPLYNPDAPGFDEEDHVGKAMYLMCYRPLNPRSDRCRQIARAWVQSRAPAFPATLCSEAQVAAMEGDWVGAVGRFWTAVQLDPKGPGPLDELALACLHFGLAAARRGEMNLSARLVRASAAAFNALHKRFPAFGPGHLHRAEFLAAAGQTKSALRAVDEALQLELTPEGAQEARDLLRDLMVPHTILSASEKNGV